jgi:signal transduction histidine kinase
MRRLIRFVRQVFSGLRFRLLMLVVLVCVPLTVLVLHTAGENRRRATAAWSAKVQTLIQIAQREEEKSIAETHQLLLAISVAPPVRSLDPAGSMKLFTELSESYPRYANLGLLTTNGEVLASLKPLPASDNQSRRRLCRRAVETGAFAIGRYARDKHDHRSFVAFGYPVLERSGEVTAVVVTELNSDSLDRFGADWRAQLPAAATWTEVDHRGVVLARFPESAGWAGRPLPQKSLLPAVLNRRTGVQESIQQGVPYLYAVGSMSSRLAGGEVTILQGIPRQVLFAESDLTLRRNLAGLGIAAGMTLILGWIGGNLLILRPVKALVKSSTQLAAGNLSVRTGLPHTGDELGKLTLAFDHMAQALEQRDLERQHATKKLQVLSRRLVEVQEAERRHIARELHDEIGQSLTAAEINLQAAALQSRGVAPTLQRRLQDSIQSVERVLEQVHDLSLTLRPTMLDDLGLEPALRWYTHRQAALTGLQAEFRADTLEDRLDNMIETECFRVAQEAVTNVVRHARALSLSVELCHRNTHLHLSVRDNGVGFDVAALRTEAVRGASLGLLSMEERTALVGGGLEISSVPGQGTEVRAWFPLVWRKPTPVPAYEPPI